MISVLNRLLPLSGNKILAAVLVLLILQACSGPKQVAKTPPVKETPPVKDDRIEVYDPEKGTTVLVPRNSVKVDTVRWTADNKPPW